MNDWKGDKNYVCLENLRIVASQNTVLFFFFFFLGKFAAFFFVFFELFQRCEALRWTGVWLFFFFFFFKYTSFLRIF